jgi:hypothetical protein
MLIGEGLHPLAEPPPPPRECTKTPRRRRRSSTLNLRNRGSTPRGEREGILWTGDTRGDKIGGVGLRARDGKKVPVPYRSDVVCTNRGASHGLPFMRRFWLDFSFY